jgi:hypothetical protein
MTKIITETDVTLTEVKEMNQAQAFEVIANAMTTKERKPDEFIKIYKPELPEDIKNSLMDIQHKMSDDTGAGFELSYEIMDNALTEIGEATFDGLDNDYQSSEFASVYTAEQLSYLTINNQSDISNIVNELKCEIGTACAIWYDSAVRTTIAEVVEYIKTFEE